MRGSLTKAAFSAFRWNYVGFAARSLSNFVIGIFLARLLGPKPFGQLAAAGLVIGIANLIADAGFPSALIQAPSLTGLQIRYVFTMQFLVAIGMSASCAALSGVVARTFHDPAVKGIVLAMSPVFLLQAFGQTAGALLRRELNFKSLQSAQLISYFVGYLLCGIPLAMAGAGVWSLVGAQIVQATLWAVLLYLRVRHSVVPTFHASGVALLRFGAKVTANNIVNYGISNADNFFVGRVFGSLSLGFYNRAFTLGNAPLDGLVGTVQQVLFASCSRAEGRLEAIRRAYLCSLSAVAFLVLPVFWTAAVCAPVVMVGLYGESWRPAAVFFGPLALALSVHSLMAVAGPVLGSLNYVQREVKAQALTLVVTLIAFQRAIHVSVLALCWAVCGVYLFRFLAVTWPMLRVVGLRWRDVVRVLIGPALLGLCTSAASWETGKHALAAHVAAFRAFLLVAAVTAVTASVLFLLLGRWLAGRELLAVLHRGSGRMPVRLSSLVLGPSLSVAPAATSLGPTGPLYEALKQEALKQEDGPLPGAVRAPESAETEVTA